MENIERYQNLELKIEKIWNCRSESILLVLIGALGTVSRQFEDVIGQMWARGSSLIIPSVSVGSPIL